MSEVQQSETTEDRNPCGFALLSIFFLVAAGIQLLSCCLWAIASRAGFDPLEQE